MTKYVILIHHVECYVYFYNNINIIGFGGKGHHTNIFNPMFHNQTRAHEFLKILKKINIISL